MASLFTDSRNIVNFDNVIKGSYDEGNQYYAGGGNDEVTLAKNTTIAAKAGFKVGTTFYGGTGDDLIIGGNGRDWLQGDEGVNRIIVQFTFVMSLSNHQRKP